MSNGEIGGFGLVVSLQADKTFPAGLVLSQFPDDADPFDFPDMKIKDVAMGLNGDLIKWSKAVPLITQIALIPDSDDDINMSTLFLANRVGKNKAGAGDIITLVGKYPDGTTITLSNGTLTDGPPSSPIASSARMKSKVYKFAFENIAIIRT